MMSRSRGGDRTPPHGALFCALLACLLYGCGGGEGGSEAPTTPPQSGGNPPPEPQPEPAPEPEPEPEPTPEPEPEPEPTPQPEPTPEPGAATVSWTAPLHNVDGTALTDLAGFRIYYGTSRDALEQIVELTNPGLTRYVIENLGASTWYFGVKAFTSKQAESALSNVSSKTIP